MGGRVPGDPKEAVVCTTYVSLNGSERTNDEGQIGDQSDLQSEP